MIAYTTVGTNDVPRASAFYDELLALLGAKRTVEAGRIILWSNKAGSPSFGLITPFDGNKATVGNGTMIVLSCDSREQVDALHKKALSLGGKDEGATGPRGPGFYGGYFRDLDGNKLACFYIGAG